MFYSDLRSHTSVSLPLQNGCRACDYDKLYVGDRYRTYIAFDLPPLAFLNRVEKAELILFKIPMNITREYEKQKINCYCVRPLLDFFSVYGDCYMPPRADSSLGVPFSDADCMSYTQVDITPIVRAWFNGSPQNKGLVVTAAPYARQLVYASDRCEVVGLRPTLRITFEGLSVPLSAAPCTVVAHPLGAPPQA